MHAHLHGSTAPQVQNGMAGALILIGDIDRTLSGQYGISLEKDNDKIMILLQMEMTDVPLCETSDKGQVIVTSVNGQCLPKISGEAGDIQRWRFIHAGISATLNLAVVYEGGKKKLHEFARDGITMNGTQVQENIVLQPGYRSDVLFQFPECQSYPCEMFLIDEETSAASSFLGESEPDSYVAKIVIENKAATAMTMPKASVFTNPYPFICEPQNFQECSEKLAVKKVWFANEPKDPNDDSQGTYKTVNGGVYPDTPVMDLTLNDKNTWKLWVGDKQEVNGASHPFHIHVNPFQVVDENGFSYWKDTLLVNGTDNYGEENAITVVSRYENFDGEFVLHCHNLDHEDDGMMMKVRINN
ncbi:multicopper oxidase domain-containing protein [Thalassomonas actiniarum]|uniref:Multicopper oxidase domain-containing protein n=2 Tax=Thalassomonas actiniarum TaxID=485447 RepID=A0AAE9YWW6_9GAMM|nr:multicopper oxidase domain-containing protein [Thalassomonas actiniarum]